MNDYTNYHRPAFPVPVDPQVPGFMPAQPMQQPENWRDFPAHQYANQGWNNPPGMHPSPYGIAPQGGHVPTIHDYQALQAKHAALSARFDVLDKQMSSARQGHVHPSTGNALRTLTFERRCLELQLRRATRDNDGALETETKDALGELHEQIQELTETAGKELADRADNALQNGDVRTARKCLAELRVCQRTLERSKGAATASGIDADGYDDAKTEISGLITQLSGDVSRKVVALARAEVDPAQPQPLQPQPQLQAHTQQQLQQEAIALGLSMTQPWTNGSVLWPRQQAQYSQLLQLQQELAQPGDDATRTAQHQQLRQLQAAHEDLRRIDAIQEKLRTLYTEVESRPQAADAQQISARQAAKDALRALDDYLNQSVLDPQVRTTQERLLQQLERHVRNTP